MAASSNLPANFTNSVSAAAAVQELTFTGPSPGVQYPIAANSVISPASAATSLTVGLAVLVQPITVAQAGVPYTYVVQTNAPSGDAVSVQYNVFPARAGGHAVQRLQHLHLDADHRPGKQPVARILRAAIRLPGPYDHDRSAGYFRHHRPRARQVPLNATAGGNVTVLFTGSDVMVYNNVNQSVLSNAVFKSSDTVQVDLPAGQANSVLVLLPNSASTPIPKGVVVQGVTGSTNNQVTVFGSPGANTFTVAGGTVTANGLATTIADVQKLTLAGRSGNDYYKSIPASAHLGRRYGRLQHDGLQSGHGGRGRQSRPRQGAGESIAPWNTTLSIYGVINKLIGSAYADDLTGGPAATTEIVAGPATIRLSAAAATTSSWAAAATTRSSAARAKTC